jgi:thiosulfate/3-mercaptopyruvate sulfurtransferase
MDPVVSADWLDEHRDDVVVADVRYYLDGRSGRDAYASGHIPGAVFVDLHEALADVPTAHAGRHPFPTPEDFAQALGALGIADHEPVVAYDDLGGTMAARLVWMLRAIGQPAALLDGGLQAYEGDLATNTPPRPMVERTVKPWVRLVDIDEAANTQAPLLDARAPERFRGEHEPLDPRAGHIPGARSVPTAANLDADGRFRSPQELRDRFTQAGITEADDPIAYCGSGVSACHLLLAMERAGLPPGRLFGGSWSQWSADPARPAEKGGG